MHFSEYVKQWMTVAIIKKEEGCVNVCVCVCIYTYRSGKKIKSQSSLKRSQ